MKTLVPICTGPSRRLGIAVMAWSLLLASKSATAQTVPWHTDATSAPVDTPRSEEEPRGATERHAPGGPQEGIKVHGYWVIEVRNPDGSLVSHTEFENSVDTSFGTFHLANVLKQNRTPGHWAIRLGGTRTGSTASTACVGSAPGTNECWIVQPGSLPAPFNAQGAGVSTNLTATIAGSSQDQLVLSGSLTIPADGRIDYVNTWQGSCTTDIAPQNCTTIQGGPVTFFPLDPLLLQQGRIVQVTVTISFS